MHLLKKMTRKGTAIFARPVGCHTVNFYVLRGHYNRHWIKSQQEDEEIFFCQALDRLQRESLSMVVVKNSLDKGNWG